MPPAIQNILHLKAIQVITGLTGQVQPIVKAQVSILAVRPDPIIAQQGVQAVVTDQVGQVPVQGAATVQVVQVVQVAEAPGRLDPPQWGVAVPAVLQEVPVPQEEVVEEEGDNLCSVIIIGFTFY